MQVVYTLEPILTQMRIKFPLKNEIAQVTTDFQDLCGLPQVLGAIDGCLIPMLCPSGEWAHRYWCYKGFHAVLLLAVVDARGYFMYIKSGLPGCVGDAAAWGACALKEYLERGDFFPSDCIMQIGDVRVSPFLVGDSAFPLTHYMMKCYSGDPRQDTPSGKFNYSLIRTRRVVENAFGRLKMRFRALREARISDLELLPKLINLCCALHNIAQQRKDPFEEPWDESNNLAPADEQDEDVGGQHSRAASVIRDTLRDHVFT